MTGIDPERLARRRHWAAEQLGLSGEATPEEVRAAWLRRLPDEGFVPTSEQRWALAVLLGRDAEEGRLKRADEAAAVEEEDRLRQEVEAFADSFWDLSPEDRRSRWQELAECCRFSAALTARLGLLEAGLDYVPLAYEGDEDNRVIELAGHVMELFVLRPGPRAQTRQVLLRNRDRDREQWKIAVRRLRQSCPTLAALGNDLLKQIQTPALQPKRPPRRSPVQPAAKAQDRSQKWPWWLILVVITTLGRIFSSGSHEAPATKVTFPTFKYPASPSGNGNTAPTPAVPPELWKRMTGTKPTQDERLKELLDEAQKRARELESKQGKSPGTEKTDGKRP